MKPRNGILDRIFIETVPYCLDAGANMRCEMRDNAAKFSYLLIGLGIGSLIGILFAPQSGEETRTLLSSKAGEGRQYAQNKARALREAGQDLIERSKEIISNQNDSLSAAVEAGKIAYQQEDSKAAATS
jgi:gas vesicle protein